MENIENTEHYKNEMITQETLLNLILILYALSTSEALYAIMYSFHIAFQH